MTVGVIIAASFIVDWGAILAAVAAIIVATGGVLATVRRIGKPNGQGNVVQMSEKLLQSQREHDQLSDQKLDLLISIAREIGEVKATVVGLAGKLEDELMHVHRRIDDMAGRR